MPFIGIESFLGLLYLVKKLCKIWTAYLMEGHLKWTVSDSASLLKLWKSEVKSLIFSYHNCLYLVLIYYRLWTDSLDTVRCTKRVFFITVSASPLYSLSFDITLIDGAGWEVWSLQRINWKTESLIRWKGSWAFPADIRIYYIIFHIR